MRFGTELLKRGFAKMQKGGVVMDVTNAEQAAIAEEAGSVAVMALERVPADIRAAGGVARMADPVKIQEIMDSVTVPVMAKCRIGHEAEARALESMGVDMIDESEVLTPADPFFHVNKRGFSVPVVNFAAGGVATPADAALMMLMGCDGVFVGSGIFKSENPESRGRAIVDAVAHFDDPSTVAEVSKGIGLAMKGMDAKALPVEARLQDRGW